MDDLKKLIEEICKDYEPPVKYLGGGLYLLTGKMPVYTNLEGVKQFEKAVEAELLKRQ